MEAEIRQSDIDWSRTQMGLLKIGGVWGVPRSYLIFQKESQDTLKLMSPTADEPLTEYQKSDFEIIQEVFGLAGVKVIR